MGYSQCNNCSHNFACVIQLCNEVPSGDCSSFEQWDGKPIKLKKREHYYCDAHDRYNLGNPPMILVKTKLPKRPGKVNTEFISVLFVVGFGVGMGMIIFVL
jgi:hypothetical protein